MDEQFSTVTGGCHYEKQQLGNPDRDVISDQFFRPGKKGAIVFKAGKCIINLHVPNHIYSAVVARKKADDSDTINEFEAGGKVAELELEAAADFTVCPSPICLRKGKIIKLKILLGSQNCSNEKQTLMNPLTKSLRFQLNYLFKLLTHHSPKT